MTSSFDKLKEFCYEKITGYTCFIFQYHASRNKKENCLRNFDITKAKGSNNIGPTLLKLLAAPFISDSLMYICNQSIIYSTFFRYTEGKGRPFEPVHEFSNNVVCATSKASDQPAHMHSLIRAFAGRLSILRLLSY